MRGTTEAVVKLRKIAEVGLGEPEGASHGYQAHEESSQYESNTNPPDPDCLRQLQNIQAVHVYPRHTVSLHLISHTNIRFKETACFICTKPTPVKLDQKQQQFQVEWIMGRDHVPNTLEDLLKCLKERCGVFLSTCLFHFILTGHLVLQVNCYASDTTQPHFTVSQSSHAA